MAVPTTKRLRLSSTIASRMKGMERKKSQMRLRMKFTGLFCKMPPSLVVNRSTPKGIPSIREMPPEMDTI